MLKQAASAKKRRTTPVDVIDVRRHDDADIAERARRLAHQVHAGKFRVLDFSDISGGDRIIVRAVESGGKPSLKLRKRFK
ncbi:MAG TPA: hypothetical protein VGJ51_18445 [Candidatus Angelobacter sp.]